MSDGRPAFIEDWFDRESRFYVRTVFYSTLGIEAWSDADHLRYVEADGLLAGRTYPSRSIGASKILDESRHELWSVNCVMAEDDD